MPTPIGWVYNIYEKKWNYIWKTNVTTLCYMFRENCDLCVLNSENQEKFMFASEKVQFQYTDRLVRVHHMTRMFQPRPSSAVITISEHWFQFSLRTNFTIFLISHQLNAVQCRTVVRRILHKMSSLIHFVIFFGHNGNPEIEPSDNGISANISQMKLMNKSSNVRSKVWGIANYD